MITYTLPDFTQGLGLNLFFCRLLAMQPEVCRPQVQVGSIYGCFPSCALNGGRTLVRNKYSASHIERTYEILDEYGLCARLTLTNEFATQQDFKDPYVQEILTRGAAHGAQAIVYSDFVRDYVRSAFGMKTVLSTTRAITDVAAFNQACCENDYVVLDYSVHKDDAFLSAIEHPEKAEVMVNEFCVAGCPLRAEHYRHNSLDQQNNAVTSFTCPHKKADFFAHEPGHPVIFTAEEVQALSERYGITNFKIVGRGVPFETVLEALTYYLVKPEYHAEVKATVLAQVKK